ncbi:MAG: hypothetical protein IJ301_01290 [Clostridia bacterium]|nr:hypothetical protein [Clostridia bacterium]
MTVAEVLKLAVLYMGEPDLEKTTTLGGTETPSEQQTEKLNRLLTCVNDTVQTLALMYFPLKKEESVENPSGQVNFSNLTRKVCDIVKIIDKHGFDADFTSFPTYFETIKGKLRVIYNFIPEYVYNFTDSIEIAMDKVNLRLVALGVVSRYFLISGMYTDAQAWENMFERAILVAQGTRKSKTIKKRRWL